MYCSNCGKTLFEDDKFCSYCGKPVRRLETEHPSSTEEVVFNLSIPKEVKQPLSNVVVENNQGENEQEASEGQQESVVKHNPEFVWNLHGFPKDEPRKTEDIDFHWDKSGEKEIKKQEAIVEPSKQAVEQLESAAEQSQTVEQTKQTVEQPQEAVILPKESTVSLEELLFPSTGAEEVQNDELKIQSEKIDKFYTFSKKNEEFQKLLDQEYEKIKTARDIDTKMFDISGDQELGTSQDSLVQGNQDDPLEDFADKTIRVTIPKELLNANAYPDFDPVTHANEATKVREGILSDNSEILDNSSIIKKFDTMELDRETLDKQSTAEEDATPEAEVKMPDIQLEEETEEDIEVETEEAQLSRTQALDKEFSKQFQKFEETQINSAAEKAKKKFGPRTIILLIIIIVLLIELGILGIKYLAPESAAAIAINQKTDTAALWVKNLMEGNNQDGQSKEGKNAANSDEGASGLPAISTVPEADKDLLIAGQLFNNKNIEHITANMELAYNPTTTYKQNSISATKPIENNLWYTQEDGTPIYYDASVVGTLIAYDSKWIDYVNNEDTAVLDLTKTDSTAYKNTAGFKSVGKITEVFKKLEIGEIRQDETGFYIWAYEEIEVTDTGKLTKKNWIYYMEPVVNQMKIVDYYSF